MKKDNFEPSYKRDSIIQLQQRIIHYLSEISSYKDQLKDYEYKLTLSNKKYAELKEKLSSKGTSREDPVIDPVIEPNIQSQAYYSYSTILPNVEIGEKDVTIVGNFIIKNTGNIPLTTPIICIRISPVQNVKLSGKIKLLKASKSEDEFELFETLAADEWVYIHDSWEDKVKNEGEHWLRPTHKEVLHPEEQMSFSNFQLTLSPPNKVSSVVVSGFAYFEELQQGITSLNQIIINF